MIQKTSSHEGWKDCRIGITGANGSLGKALIKVLREKGAYVIGLTHTDMTNRPISDQGPQEWISWKCGEENLLENTLTSLDILVLNHGINPKGNQTSKALDEALEVNALSSWRLMKQFEDVASKKNNFSKSRELWVNTSEAEIQPAFSPGYEISKRLIGQLVSLRSSNLSKDQQKKLKIRKLVLGPFFSELNPLGIMKADFVATQIINQVEFGLTLVIVTPNPLTYFLMPLSEIFRTVYFLLTRNIFSQG